MRRNFGYYPAAGPAGPFRCLTCGAAYTASTLKLEPWSGACRCGADWYGYGAEGARAALDAAAKLKSWRDGPYGLWMLADDEVAALMGVDPPAGSS